MENKVYCGNNIDVLKNFPDNSIDSVVTDPPYELGFMGKKWDATGIAYSVELWTEILRVLKPGGHLLSFGGTRTYHRMACAIEDAGFEIRDCIQWIYGSGFPKSLDISKAIDKKAGVTREAVGLSSGPNNKTYEGDRYTEKRKTKFGVVQDQPVQTKAMTEHAKQWAGWGTALKPANEPIVVARKPLSEKTIIENVLLHGTGGINIDGCRVPTPDGKPAYSYPNGPGGICSHEYQQKSENAKAWNNFSTVLDNEPSVGSDLGRFPANVILDEEAGALLDEQTGILTSGSLTGQTQGDNNIYGKRNKIPQYVNGNSGGASRFFYCAKASPNERGMANTHPTVKPLKLMEYLVKLVTPSGGIVLDPFAGSGTTLVASKQLGFKYIGIELNKEYVDIINLRLDAIKPIKSIFKRNKK